MEKYIESQCAKCEKIGRISLSDFTKTKNTMPKGWKYRDLGALAEEPFEVCAECWGNYNDLEEKYFREYIRNA